jgi:hypothetical protein
VSDDLETLDCQCQNKVAEIYYYDFDLEDAATKLTKPVKKMGNNLR